MSSVGCEDEGSVIQEFYRDTNVFITGGTGFIGKVLIEKLLRSCPHVNTIYLLVRSKRGKQVEERIDELIKSPCFDRLKEERPGFESKLVAVAGDIGMEGLGISDQDRHLLAEHVDIVFHVAATVRFNEQLNAAIKLNVRATRDLLIMCKTFNKLKSLVHVSTAYSNCPQPHIEEKFYEPPMDCDRAIQMAECVDEQLMNDMQDKILGEWPNTYTFTKALAEGVVKKYGEGLPVAVVRPPGVLSTYREPVSGFVDDRQGPGMVLAAVLSGVLRTMWCVDSQHCNNIPCDMVVNSLIAAAWEIADTWQVNGMIPVYNAVSVSNNGTTLKEYFENYMREMSKTPYSGTVWYPMFVGTTSQVRLKIYRLILHYLPAALMDGAALATGKQPKMFKMYEKMHDALNTFQYFYKCCWSYEHKGLSDLWNKMNARDKELFPFDMSSLVWEDFYKETCLGLREHLLKDGIETLPAAKTRMQRLLVLHRAVQATLLFVPSYLLAKSIQSKL